MSIYLYVSIYLYIYSLFSVYIWHRGLRRQLQLLVIALPSLYSPLPHSRAYSSWPKSFWDCSLCLLFYHKSTGIKIYEQPPPMFTWFQRFKFTLHDYKANISPMECSGFSKPLLVLKITDSYGRRCYNTYIYVSATREDE